METRQYHLEGAIHTRHLTKVLEHAKQLLQAPLMSLIKHPIHTAATKQELVMQFDYEANHKLAHLHKMFLHRSLTV